MLKTPIEALGFEAIGLAAAFPSTDPPTDGDGNDMTPSSGSDAAASPQALGDAESGPPGPYSGVWLSKYSYFSTGRGQELQNRHYVVLLQHGNRLTVRSLPQSGSQMGMDLSIDGTVCTGTWTEQTEEDGYYRGAVYHGAIQLLIDPTGRRMSGKWVGFGKDFDINTGPWELVFQNASTHKSTLDTFNQPPPEE